MAKHGTFRLFLQRLGPTNDDSFTVLKPRGVSCLLGSREDAVITEQGQRRVT